jgi:hypothetical protein
MKKLLICILFFGAVEAHAQLEEKISSSAIYKVEVIKDGVLVTDDSCILNISNHYSYFFSVGERFVYNADPKKFYKNTYYKNYSQNKSYKIASLANTEYAYPLDSIVAFDWKLEKDSLVINKIKCFKATGKVNNIVYTVWYAPSIPVSDGPAFIKGLPGLVLKANTEDGTVKMSLLSYSKNIKNNEINKLKYPFEFTTYEWFKTKCEAAKEQASTVGGLTITVKDESHIGNIRRVN